MADRDEIIEECAKIADRISEERRAGLDDLMRDHRTIAIGRLAEVNMAAEIAAALRAIK